MAGKDERPSALIIGAGVGGVSTAARLAHAGFQVTVLEKNGFTGGRCSLIYSDGSTSTSQTSNPSASKSASLSDKAGSSLASASAKPDQLAGSSTERPYRFDQGPSLLLLPHLFERTFHDLDTSLEKEGVKFLKCEPNYKIHFGDGEQFKLSSDLAVMKTEIERWEGKEGYERYLRFLEESHRHYELSVKHVLLRNFTGLISMFRWEFLRNLVDLHPFESIWARASRYFFTERLRRVFTFGSMYMGMSPFDAPGTYSLLQYTELAEGIWYPVGGFHRVVQALVEIGERKGVEFRLNTPVKRIVMSQDGGRAEGVELENGEVLRADVVVCNADLVYAYNNLLPGSGYGEALEQRPGSCSSISFYWGLSRKVPELSAHNIFLADEYRESFDSIFKKHLIPDEPSFYVNVPSRIDPTAAPEGKDSVVVLVPVGHLIDSQQSNGSLNTATNGSIKSASPKGQTGLTPTTQQNWPAMIALARKTILATIASRTGVDLTPLITHESTNTPPTWLSKFNLNKGAILGLSHSFFNVLCFRPSTRARRRGPLDDVVKGWGVAGTVVEVLVDAVRGRGRDVKGLYFVGASAHPGTGVPIVLAGGALVAEQVLGDLGREIPWRERKEGKGRVGKLDEVDLPFSVAYAGLLKMVVPWLFALLLFGLVMGFMSTVSGNGDRIGTVREL